MKRDFHFNQSFTLLAIAAVMVVFVLIMVISNLFSQKPTNPSSSSIIPTPTPVPYTRQNNGTFTFTPLQKTTINKTTNKEIEEEQRVLNKSIRGPITVYEVPSATPQETDEIRTQDGIVVFESVNLFNDKAGMPPKVSVYEKEFGEPEKILKSVSEMGLHISAHIYAKDGFTLFVNHNTNTVYEIHRFIPMSTEEYERQYAEYLHAAPEYPKEFFGE